MVQHTVSEVRFEQVGEYVHCVAVGSDGTCLALSEAAERRDAAWGVRRELRTQLDRECRRRK